MGVFDPCLQVGANTLSELACTAMLTYVLLTLARRSMCRSQLPLSEVD